MQANLKEADFTGADLSGASLEGAALDGAILKNAILQNAYATEVPHRVLSHILHRHRHLPWLAKTHERHHSNH